MLQILQPVKLLSRVEPIWQQKAQLRRFDTHLPCVRMPVWRSCEDGRFRMRPLASSCVFGMAFKYYAMPALPIISPDPHLCYDCVSLYVERLMIILPSL